jgi:hypothetical protein
MESELAAEVQNTAQKSAQILQNMETEDAEHRKVSKAQIDELVSSMNSSIEENTRNRERFEKEHLEWAETFRGSAVSRAEGIVEELRTALTSTEQNLRQFEEEQSKWITQMRESAKAQGDGFAATLESELENAKSARATFDAFVHEVSDAEEKRSQEFEQNRNELMRKFETEMAEVESAKIRIDNYVEELHGTEGTRLEMFEAEVREAWLTKARGFEDDLARIRKAREGSEDCLLEMRTLEVQRAIEFQGATQFAKELANEFDHEADFP